MDESLASIILNSVQIPSFVCSGTMAIELREFNETKKNNVDKMLKFIIWPKSGNLVH